MTFETQSFLGCVFNVFGVSVVIKMTLHEFRFFFFFINDSASWMAYWFSYIASFVLSLCN